MVERVPFRLADALQNHLARCLSGDAPEIPGRNVHQHHFAQVGVRLDTARFLQRNFARCIRDALDHRLFAIDMRRTCLQVQACGDARRRTKSAPIRRNQCGMDGLQHHFLGELAFVAHLIDGRDKLFIHNSSLTSCLCYSLRRSCLPNHIFLQRKVGGNPLFCDDTRLNHYPLYHSMAAIANL